jgi:hypothetical protein
MGDLLSDVNAYLHSQTMLEECRLAGYTEYIMDDLWVRDFSKVWGNERNGDPPQLLIDETEAFLRHEKDAAIVTPVSPQCYVLSDTEADRVQIWTGRGTAEVLKSDVQALIAALTPLATPATVYPGHPVINIDTMPPKQALSGPQQLLQKRNDENLEYALKQANKKYYGR